MATPILAERSAKQLDEVASSASLAARYESLIRLAEAIRSQHDQKELFRLLANELNKVVQFDGMAQFDAAANKIHWHLCDRCAALNAPPLSDLEKEETVAWWVHRTNQPVVIPFVDRETRFPATIERLKQLGLRSICALPLRTAHRLLGSLLLASEQADAYSDDAVRFLSLVADQVALAMDDALNFQESQRAQERLKLLLDLTNQVVANLDLRDLLRQVSGSIRKVMQCDGVGVTLPDPETGQLRLYALDFPGSNGVLREGITTVVDATSTVARVFETGQPINLTEADIIADRLPAAAGAKSMCRFPLLGRKRVLGVLTLGTVRENAFADDDLAFLGQVASQIAIAVENAIAYGQIADLKDKLAQEKIYLEDEIRSELNFEEIVGTSDVLVQVLKQIETVAPTDSTVLIYGETGTGKELIARAVHNLSSRKTNAFVKLNCAAIPTGLLESELFGHEKGAFTGAISQRVGRFELAHRGTVFLDEVGEIPLELQPKLLRVLQEREFERLGSTRTLRTDARLIAATNRDLEEMVQEQKFRSDLYYRLNVFPVRIPPLRERPEDIPLLVRHFVQQFSRRNNRAIDSIPSDTMDALVRYHWPGNIRELQNVIERAVIVSKGPVLQVSVADLKPRPESLVSAPVSKSTSGDNRGENLRTVLDDAERKQIVGELERANWVVAGPNGAAARLGMKRSTLQFRMRKLGIRVSRTGN
ncbi:MAG TPA: sigma 54-interacting transcriptional regulator [Bryobacteraceae bacterium]|nr:sigma 54-interacting transcriptional regulator [Bryobacteraceae bacterium]